MTVAFMFLIALFIFQLVYSFLSIKEAKMGMVHKKLRQGEKINGLHKI